MQPGRLLQRQAEHAGEPVRLGREVDRCADRLLEQLAARKNRADANERRVEHADTARDTLEVAAHYLGGFPGFDKVFAHNSGGDADDGRAFRHFARASLCRRAGLRHLLGRD